MNMPVSITFICLMATSASGLLSNNIYNRVVSCLDPLSVNGTGIVSSSTRTHCALSCSSSPRCTSFSFKAKDDGGSCYLNTNVALTDTECVTPVQTFSLYNEKDQVCNGQGVYLTNRSKCRCHDGYLGDSCERLMQDCTEGSEYYDKERGLFFIQPRSSKAIFRVFCNMIWGGRSYMMIIEKDGPYMNFTRSWQEYKDGFGVSEYDVINKKGSFWAGNELLHKLTTSRRYTLTVEAGYETYKQYIYEGFVVQGESEGYAFSFDHGHPNGNDGGTHILGDALTQANGTKFSTYDVDNDLSDGSCANIHQSGWWFTTCLGYNPTGQPQSPSEKRMSPDPISLSWPVNGDLSPRYIHFFLRQE